jgi:hypothetical protein
MSIYIIFQKSNKEVKTVGIKVFLSILEGSGSQSLPLTNGSGSQPVSLTNGSGSRRPKNLRIPIHTIGAVHCTFKFREIGVVWLGYLNLRMSCCFCSAINAVISFCLVIRLGILRWCGNRHDALLFSSVHSIQLFARFFFLFWCISIYADLPNLNLLYHDTPTTFLWAYLVWMYAQLFFYTIFGRYSRKTSPKSIQLCLKFLLSRTRSRIIFGTGSGLGFGTGSETLSLPGFITKPWTATGTATGQELNL